MDPYLYTHLSVNPTHHPNLRLDLFTQLCNIDYIGMYQIVPDTARSPLTISAPSNVPIPQPTHSPPQTASRSNEPFYHNTLSGLTGRLTDGIGDNYVPRALTLMLCR